jgi:hypothetical protein
VAFILEAANNSNSTKNYYSVIYIPIIALILSGDWTIWGKMVFIKNNEIIKGVNGRQHTGCSKMKGKLQMSLTAGCVDPFRNPNSFEIYPSLWNTLYRIFLGVLPCFSVF